MKLVKLLSKSLILASVAVVTISCSGGGSNNDTAGPVTPPVVQETNEQIINNLWPQTAGTLLTEDLWSTRDKYDTAHILMQPMQYAFAQEQQDKVEQFNDFFSQLDLYFDDAISDSRGATTQFMYFVSEYLVLTSESDFSASNISLHNKLQSWLVNFFAEPAWMWSREPFASLTDRTAWKLATTEPARGYYRAMFDEDLFAYGVLSNLIYIQAKQNEITASAAFSALVAIAQPQLKQMLQQEVSSTSASNQTTKFNWLFQPGVWAEHPDYRFVGNTELTSSLEEMPMTGIATDSSHMHRWPLWLKSYSRAFTQDSDMLQHIDRLQTGLAQQFNEVVYVASNSSFSAPRMNNFFDGHNGVYRYQYITQAGSGYGPYQLSSALFVGWYGNLVSADAFVKDLEALVTGKFELSQSQIDTYVGPNTTRERNPKFTLPDYFNNGMAELNIRVSLALLKQ